MIWFRDISTNLSFSLYILNICSNGYQKQSLYKSAPTHILLEVIASFFVHSSFLWHDLIPQLSTANINWTFKCNWVEKLPSNLFVWCFLFMFVLTDTFYPRIFIFFLWYLCALLLPMLWTHVKSNMRNFSEIISRKHKTTS